jgi:hypothetical protein
MNMSLPLARLLTTCFILSMPLALEGQGPGPIGRGGMGGFQEAIHHLFANHTKIKRAVEITETGYKSRTVSDDPEIAMTLQKHVKEMRERLGSGMMIRRWDPAFAELVEHYTDVDHEFKEVPGGVEMVVKGKTPDAIKVAQNHARIVSGFVEKGPEQMHASHPRALGGEKPSEPTGNNAKATCPICKETPNADCASCKAAEAKPEPAATATAKAAESPAPHHPLSASDARKPLPLLAHMAEHQRANMRDHLAAIYEIASALSVNDFDGVAKSAARIGYSEKMGQMCSHMGAGAPGFTDAALYFHRTADTIGLAAKQRDAGATLKAVSATLQTCVSCHATYRQEIVDEGAWEKITKQH